MNDFSYERKSALRLCSHCTGIVKRCVAENVLDKASVHTRNATFGTISAPEQEHLFLFTLYRISFCDAPFHYLAQCEHSLKLLIYRSQTFLVKYIQLCEDQGIPGKLKKHVCNLVLAILMTYMETRLKPCSQ